MIRRRSTTFDNISVREPRKGKGFVVESMFDRVNADLYIMVDGDDTYPADKVHDLLAPLLSSDADMVVGARLKTYTEKAFRNSLNIDNRYRR